MPWGMLHELICIDCGEAYTTGAFNTSRCKKCRRLRENQKRNQRHRERRGELFGCQSEHQQMSDTTRFNMQMAGAIRSARCPKCSRHMQKCTCRDETIRLYQPPKVRTWKPWL